MNLTIDNVVNTPGCVAILMDGYVPVEIKIIDSKGAPPLYWRMGDGQKSLLELAVLPENGFLSSITLVMIDPGSVSKTSSLSLNISNDRYGIPVVNTKIWKCTGNDDFSQRFIDDFTSDIQIVISSNAIFFTIGDNKKNIVWIKCSDNFYLGVDNDGNITNLFLDKLTQEEIERFIEAVG